MNGNDDILPTAGVRSPWMRGAPQKGLAVAIFRIKALISRLDSGRPVRLLLEIHAQKRVKIYLTLSQVCSYPKEAEAFPMSGHNRLRPYDY